MDAQEQKHHAAKQSSTVFNQHHQVHLVRHRPTEKLTHWQKATEETVSGLFSPTLLTVSLCCLQKREQKKEEEERRKTWVDQEREKTLSRLRSFRQVKDPPLPLLLFLPQRLLIYTRTIVHLNIRDIIIFRYSITHIYNFCLAL